MSSTWNNCLSKLENEIPSSDYSTWIRPLQAIESNNKLKILAPNRFIIDHIKQHFITKIEDVVYEFSNGSLIIQFEIGSKKPTAQAPAGLPRRAPPNKTRNNPVF
jgi:chromosomal replication initiator protein